MCVAFVEETTISQSSYNTITYVSDVYGHVETTHEGHGSLHVIRNGASWSGAKLHVVVEVSIEGRILLEGEVPLRNGSEPWRRKKT